MVYIPYRHSPYGMYWYEPDYHVDSHSKKIYSKSYSSYLDEHLSHNIDLKYNYLTYCPLWEADRRSLNSWKYFTNYLKSYTTKKDLGFRNKHFGPLPNTLY